MLIYKQNKTRVSNVSKFIDLIVFAYNNSDYNNISKCTTVISLHSTTHNNKKYSPAHENLLIL